MALFHNSHLHFICSKAPFGFYIRLSNKLRRIGEHQNMLERSKLLRRLQKSASKCVPGVVNF